MMAGVRPGRLAVVVPVVTGVGLLVAAALLLPGRLEVDQAERRALPEPAATAVSSLPPVATPAPTPVPSPPRPLPPAPPSLAVLIPTADAADLAALTARLIGEGQKVSTAQVAYDLVARRRPAVALAYLAARPDGSAPATWRLRIDLLHKAGRHAEAAALVAAAVKAKGAVPPADLIAAAYAIDQPDLVIAAAASGAIPPPDGALALDLARRADKAGRGDWIVALDRATRADWRAADPWLAIRVAARNGDSAAGLRAAARLPADQRDAAREAILTRAGDKAGLRRLLLARAEAPGAAREGIAEQLLAAGYRDDAAAVLRRAAAGGSPSTPAARRLLYLIGPRPGAADLAWLREQAGRGSAAEQLAWLTVYADRARPREALATLAAHPLGGRTDVLLLRASLARASGDDAGARAAVAGLLDGRPLDGAQLRRLSAVVPADRDPAQAAAIAKRRIAGGVAKPRDALDLAWAAWNGGDAAGTVRGLQPYLAAHPRDPGALRLMADAQARTGGARAARPWLERALATTDDGRTQVELLERLGQRGEAVALVEQLRAEAPQDRSLAALHARLLIAQGKPGAAQAVLAR
ncbi:hypothetical protein M9979_03535 [Sphingomonas sp. RP10(2022)]|uniref:Tetratricopeptide repeat protein n=1 Tax=Sphingomonas liriopis TaxID=2949094 RepID=A0A9X2KPV1_9SPHN|nr:hypothetical protein [Sphingomonas liriopis]MCP3733946.1 hypothetical protein [Sphingomonas liriopis]